MYSRRGIQMMVIAAVSMPLLFSPLPTNAGGKHSYGSKGNRQGGSAQMWQSRQGDSAGSGKHQQGGQQQLQTQDQARTRTSIRHRVRDDDIYGHQMMTQGEKERYRTRLNSARNDREWVRLRSEHQRQMSQRASERDVALDPPIYGRNMITREERLRFNRRLATATSTEERDRIRNEHRLMIEQRARDLGIDAPLTGEDN